MKLARAGACLLIAAIPAWIFTAEFESQRDVVPMPRPQALVFVGIAIACALVLAGVGYLRHSRLVRYVFLAGALLPILCISARNFDIGNPPTIVRTDVLWQILSWSLRVAFALTLGFGVIVLSNVCREGGGRWSLLSSTTTAACVVLALLFASLAGTWANTALWNASEKLWQPRDPNAWPSPPVPNLIGVQYIVECMRLAIVFISLLWLWSLAWVCFVMTGTAIDKQTRLDAA